MESGVLSIEHAREITGEPVTIDEIVSLADRMLADRDRVVAELDEELERVHARYTLLQAMRAAIEPYAEEVAEEAVLTASDAELPLTEPDFGSPSVGSLEDAMIKAIKDRGPLSAKQLAELTGTHHTKIGRVVSAFPGLFARDGKLITLGK